MSLVLTTRETDYIMEERVKLYRPTKARTILQKDSSAPPWADRILIPKVDMFASLAPTAMVENNPPEPSISRDSTSYKVIEFMCAYSYMNAEILRCRQLGVPLDVRKAAANQMAWEQLIDRIAAAGDTTLGLGGLGSNASVPTVSRVGAAWGDTGADPEQTLADLHNLVNAVYENSNEIFQADTVILPLTKYHYCVRTRLGDGTDETILTAFQKQSPYVRRVVPWQRFATLGAGDGTRACAFDSQSPFAPRLIIPQELTDLPAEQRPTGPRIPQNAVFGGVIIENEKSVAYMDGV